MPTTNEKFTVSGSQLVDKFKEIIKEGNARRFRIIHEGRTLMDIPLTAGVAVGAASVIWLPVLAALGAFAALVTNVTIEVEKVEDTSKPSGKPTDKKE
jgi:hypothetical protein